LDVNISGGIIDGNCRLANDGLRIAAHQKAVEQRPQSVIFEKPLALVTRSHGSWRVSRPFANVAHP
jgi:hypothetical protein